MKTVQNDWNLTRLRESEAEMIKGGYAPNPLDTKSIFDFVAIIIQELLEREKQPIMYY
jgi:hypothetical protein